MFRFFKRSIFLLVVVALVASSFGMRSVSNKWAGVLCDRRCYMHAALRHDMGMLTGHDRSCIMKCAKLGRGLGLLINDTFYGLDRNGEKLGWKLIGTSKLENNFRVSIEGTLLDSTILVHRMTLQ